MEGERRPQQQANRATGREVHRGSETQDFARLRPTQIVNGIEAGDIRDTGAVKVLVRQQLELLQQTVHGASRKELEGRYAPLVAGEPKALARYCQQEADTAMSLNYTTESDFTDYPAAERWYEMAARFADEAAGVRTAADRPTPLRQAPVEQPTVPPAARAETLLNGIEDGSITNPEAVHETVGWLLETERQQLRSSELRREREAAYAELIYGSPQVMVQFCLDEATARLGLDVPGSPHANEEAAGHWYRMAARFARRAQEDRERGIGGIR